MHSGHFEGKSVVAHLREARTRGAIAAAEVHGTEISGHHAAALDAAKETALALLILSVLGVQGPLLLFFAFGWLLWKIGRSALLGYARMERLHRLIEEERWEIEHHRQQEREELTELYRAKGFSGKLLEEVIDVLMADDHRLLRVMLEEELGVALEAYEHPLKQAAGAGVGALGSGVLLLIAAWTLPFWGLGATAGGVLLLSAWGTARLERNRPLPAVVWTLAIALLVAGAVFCIATSWAVGM